MQPIVLVSGSRRFDRSLELQDVLSQLAPAVLCVGDAIGADKIARDWATWSQTHCRVNAADWPRFGKAAGPMRNAALVKDWLETNPAAPHVAVFCWSAASACRGTCDTFRRVRPVLESLTRPGWATAVHIGPLPPAVADQSNAAASLF